MCKGVIAIKKKNNFNAVASFYDGLSRLVFGYHLKNAQIEAIRFIPQQSAILIAGGGTGWILEEIAGIIPQGLNITYIDKSSKMIELSKKRNIGDNKVTFVNNALENVSLPYTNYDVVLTPFFLDCFSAQTLPLIINKLDSTLKSDGLWLNIDFYLSSKSAFWQKILITLMYAFFRLTSHIEATQLPVIDYYFPGYKVFPKKMYYHNFIQLLVLQKHS